jgi:predicted Zn-dependent protease with MMP-like domain
MDISDEQFEALINEAMEELPQEYIERLDNVAITYADEPTPEQREKLKLRGNETLFGLYEGIPLTKRGAGYSLVLPDKITIFKLPILTYVATLPELKEQVKRTLWHEIAHYYGLDHDRIHELERKPHADSAD